MFLLLPLGLVPFFAAVGVGFALISRVSVEVRAASRTEIRALQRRGLVARFLGLGLGAVSAALVALGIPVRVVTGPGSAVAIAPAVGFGVFLLVTCLAELGTPGPQSRVRLASMRTRRVSDVLPRSVTTLGAVGALALGGALVAGWAMGAPDDVGRPGRSLTTVCRGVIGADGAQQVGSSHGPWPGSYYAVPMLVGLAAAVLLVGATVRAVVRRARPGAESEDADDALRRESARVVLLGLGAFTLLTLVPVAGLMTGALLGVDCAPLGYRLLALVTGVATPVAATVGAWCLGASLVGPRLVEAAERSAVGSGSC